jgi:hypothetical protein
MEALILAPLAGALATLLMYALFRPRKRSARYLIYASGLLVVLLVSAFLLHEHGKLMRRATEQGRRLPTKERKDLDHDIITHIILNRKSKGEFRRCQKAKGGVLEAGINRPEIREMGGIDLFPGLTG